MRRVARRHRRRCRRGARRTRGARRSRRRPGGAWTTLLVRAHVEGRSMPCHNEHVSSKQSGGGMRFVTTPDHESVRYGKASTHRHTRPTTTLNSVLARTASPACRHSVRSRGSGSTARIHGSVAGVSRMYRAVSRLFRDYRAGYFSSIAAVSRSFAACFAIFRECRTSGFTRLAPVSRRFARVSRQVSRVDGGAHMLCVTFTWRDVCIMQPTKVVCIAPRLITHQWDEIGQCGHSTLKLFGHLWVTSVHN